METRHNTSLLEKAVEHSVRNASIPSRKAEAAAKEVEARAHALRRLATGGGIALAAIGIGLGVWLALRQPEPISIADKTQISTLEEKVRDAEKKLEEANGKNDDLQKQLEEAKLSESTPDGDKNQELQELKDKNAQQELALKEAEKTAQDLRQRLDSMTGGDPLTDYSIFKRKIVNFKGRQWQVTAGHEFASNADKQWRNAWCYVNPEIDGVRLNIDLVTRDSPDAPPKAPVTTAQTLQKAGLSTDDALYLGSHCDWLDGKTFTQAELSKSDLSPAPPPVVNQDGDVLVYNGAINQIFLDTLKSRTFKTLQITSDGGSIQYSLQAGQYLRSNGKNVEVKESCFSACVFVVAGGVRRGASPDAKIGVHQFYSTERVDSDTATSDAQQISSLIIQYLTANGVNPDLFHEMVKVPPTEILVIPHPQLEAWKLLNSSGTGVVLLPPPDKRMVFEARDMIGGDGTSQKGLSQNECEASCRFDTLCKGFTYDKWNKLCLLKTGAGLLRLDPRTVTVILSGAVPRESSAPLQIMKRNNRAFPDHPYRSPAAVNYDECAEYCMKDNTCLGVNFRESSQKCEMLAAPSEYGPQTGVSIGIKSQAATAQ